MIDDLTRNILEQRNNIENQNERILNSNREYYIKQLEQKIDKVIKIIENDTDLNSQRQRQRMLKILKGGNDE